MISGLLALGSGACSRTPEPTTRGDRSAPASTPSEASPQGAAPGSAAAEGAPAEPAESAESADGSDPVPDPVAGKPSAQPGGLEGATPARPLAPEQPAGPTVRNAPAPPSGGPPKLDALKLPDGFSIHVYADGLPQARSLARGREGTLFVSTRRDDRVYATRDDDGDHRADAVFTIAKGLDTPNGIAYRDGSLYIAEIERILRIDDIDEHLEDPPAPTVVTSALPGERHHGWRTIRFGPDGLLYVPIGAPCNVCLREEPIFASIARMQPDGSGLEVFAHGIRNSVGFDWHPETKELWFTENGRDELGDDLPPDELNRAPKPGLHFGFPHCHAGVITDPEHGAGHPCTDFVPPEQRLGPHVAALGMRFYTGSMFPPRYRNAVVIAEHGSWNRSEKLGYRVMVVPLKDGKAAGYEPLITGFASAEDDQAWGRPVDVEVLDDGSLLVSDDWAGVVYRVTYSG